MPRPLKGLPKGRPRKVADPSPELVHSLSLAGIPSKRIAELLGLPLETFERRYQGHLKCGPKMPVSRVAALVDKVTRMAERARGPSNIPHVLAVAKFLAPLHLVELHKALQGDVAPSGPPQITIIGADLLPDAPP